jgi:hypothetical protein
MAFRHHEKKLHRHHQSRILRSLEGWVWVPRDTRLLKTSYKRLHQIRFFFSMLKMQKICSNGFSTHSNIASSTTKVVF